ncbi:MAG: lytic transglycosylase domain-containing protein, partial [Sphingomicrobium sp.]
MRRLAIMLPLLHPAASSASAQFAPVPYTTTAPAASPVSVNYALNDWRQLRQSSGYRFADYARFLISNPGWPGDTSMRLNAEKAMLIGETPATILAFFQNQRPTTGNGFAQLALALAASGHNAEALNEAKNAWASGDLGAEHEQQLYARLGGNLSWAEHDRRADALLFDKKPREAERFLALTSAPRRASFGARIAMQTRAIDSETRFQAVAGNVATDAGLLMDRLRYLRDGGNDQLARQLAARPHNFAYRPEDPERFYEMLLALAQGAAADRQ